MRIYHGAILGLLVLMLTGCNLKFGKDVELSGAAFDGAKLKEVSALTGINFPAGSEGREYLYLGSGIDDALAAKIRIPEEGVEEFLRNPVFESGRERKPGVQIGRQKKWWKMDELGERIDRTQELSAGRFLELSCGMEGADFVVYLSWITT